MTAQNFSVSAANDALVTVTVDTTVPTDTLAGSTIWWEAFAQAHGVPSGSPLITKTNQSGGGGLDILESPAMTFTLQLSNADTALPLGNYYHEAVVIDEIGERVTILSGIMTVTQSLIAN